jgi:hypothetical protein
MGTNYNYFHSQTNKELRFGRAKQKQGKTSLPVIKIFILGVCSTFAWICRLRAELIKN